MTGLQMLLRAVRTLGKPKRGSVLRLQVSGVSPEGDVQHLDWMMLERPVRRQDVEFLALSTLHRWQAWEDFAWKLHLTHHACAHFGERSADVTGAIREIVSHN